MFFSKKVSLKQTQDLLLNLLKIIDEICRENNLKYWIDGGTLLGAVRNSKFIAWDDDIDICLLSDDYQKLLDILNSKYNLDENIFVFNNYRPYEHWSSYLADSSILKKQNLPYKIDILSVKSIPNTEAALKIDKSIINFAAYFFRGKFKYEDVNMDIHTDIFLNKTPVFKQRSHYVTYLNNYVKTLNSKNEAHLYSYPFNDIYIKRERDYYTYDDLFPIQEMDFEGMKVMAPNNPNSYLSNLYGENFMTPPPVELQQPASSKMIAKGVPNFVVKANIYVLFLLKEIKYVFKRVLTKK